MIPGVGELLVIVLGGMLLFGGGRLGALFMVARRKLEAQAMARAQATFNDLVDKAIQPEADDPEDPGR